MFDAHEFARTLIHLRDDELIDVLDELAVNWPHTYREIIATIKKSKTKEEAHQNLMKNFRLSDRQTTAILEMRLQTLSGLERKKIEDEYLEVIQLIAELEDILANPQRVLAIIKDELRELKRKYAGQRRTRVQDDASREMTDEDLIADEDVLMTISGRGYIKRQPVATYRRQHRGGKGIIGHVTREEDAVEHLLAALVTPDDGIPAETLRRLLPFETGAEREIRIQVNEGNWLVVARHELRHGLGKPPLVDQGSGLIKSRNILLTDLEGTLRTILS